MFGLFDFCLPTRGIKVPDRPEWIHELKYDGFRLRVERDGDRVRLITRGGYDWTKRYPWIVEAALKNSIRQFVIIGEAGANAPPCLLARIHNPWNALHNSRRGES